MPVFPLNAVVFPGVVLPLHIFEDRYRALVRDLQRITDPAERLVAMPAIREGYEVGNHGVQSMHRVGTLVQLTCVVANDDGTFDVEVTGRHRIRIDELEPTEDYLRAVVADLPDRDEPDAQALVEQVMARFARYSQIVAELAGVHLDTSGAPRDPAYLSYWLAAACPLAMHQRQSLLEADSASQRLHDLDRMLRTELAAISVTPSLPATELARTRWSPN